MTNQLTAPALPGFSAADLEAMVAKLQQGMTSFRDGLSTFLSALRDAASRYLSSAWSTVSAVTDELLDLGHQVLATLADLLKGAKSPMAMYQDALTWQQIRLAALEVGDALDAANLNPDSMWNGHANNSVWNGIAADAYQSSVPAQQRAALRVATIADQAAASLTTCASFGLSFYTGLVQLVVNMVAALGQFINIIRGNPLQALNAAQALAGKVKELLQNVISIASSLIQTVNAQAIHVAALATVTAANNDFPNGAWPDPTGNKRWPHPGAI